LARTNGRRKEQQCGSRLQDNCGTKSESPSLREEAAGVASWTLRWGDLERCGDEGKGRAAVSKVPYGTEYGVLTGSRRAISYD